MSTLRLRTKRLSISAVDADDLDELLAVRLSNPERLLRTEGSAGEAGFYDLGMLERDAMVAAMDSSRHFAAVRGPDGRVIGLLDLLVEHHDDGHPWIGAVEILRSEQRKGYGTETLTAALDFLAQERPGTDVHALVDHDDTVAHAFLQSCGFERTAGPQDRRKLLVFRAVGT